MKLVKLTETIPIVNCDEFVANNQTITMQRNRHGNQQFPNHVRCLICGCSNSGKTTALLSMLLSNNGIRFENVYLFSKSLAQPKYLMLKLCCNSPGVEYHEFSNVEDVTRPEDMKPNSIVIFDDIMAGTTFTPIKDFFSRGRHKNLDCFLLSQTYSSIPKQLIRDNSNLVILYKMDDLNLEHVYKDHVNGDMSFQQFKDICHKCWTAEPYGFIVIDKENTPRQRYRYKFDSNIVVC